MLGLLPACLAPQVGEPIDEGAESQELKGGVVFADAQARAADGTLDSADVAALIARARSKQNRQDLVLTVERYGDLCTAALRDTLLRASIDPVTAGVPNHRNDAFFAAHPFRSAYHMGNDTVMARQLHNFSFDAPTFFGTMSLETAQRILKDSGLVPAQLIMPDGSRRVSSSVSVGDVMDSSFGAYREVVATIGVFPEGSPASLVETPFTDPFSVLTPGFQKGAETFPIKFILNSQPPTDFGRDLLQVAKFVGEVTKQQLPNGATRYAVKDRSGLRVLTLTVPRVAPTPQQPGTPAELPLRYVSRLTREQPVLRWTALVTNPPAETSIPAAGAVEFFTESRHGQELAEMGFKAEVLMTWRDVQEVIE